MFDDTIFSQIVFSKDDHTYHLNGRRLNNVSALIKSVTPPFDAPAVATRVAAKRGTTPAEILAEWDQKRQAGLDLGNAVHEYIQQALASGQAADDPFLALNHRPPQCDQFDRLWAKLEPHNQVIKIEWIIGDAELGLAGTADCLLLNHKTGQFHLFDWKTNSKFRLDNPWQNLLPPFDDLNDCDWNKYSLQISLYRLIIERNLGLPMGHSYICHLRPDDHELHQALDLREECEKWLMETVTV